MMKIPHGFVPALRLTAVIAAPLCGAVLYAQITSPDTLVAPAPGQPAHRDQLGRTTLRSADLQWMWKYTQPGSDSDRLLTDTRFEPFLKAALPGSQNFADRSDTLHSAAENFMARPGVIIADDNRYITVDGCRPHFCVDRGMLWIDLGQPHPFVAFAAITWNADDKASWEHGATYTMRIFSNRPLEAGHFPPALTHSIARWTSKPSYGSKELQNITSVFVVDSDGTPHPISPNEIGAPHSTPAETNPGSR